jgi:hypothetical protein
VVVALAVGYMVECCRKRTLFVLGNLGMLFVLFYSAVSFAFHGLPRYHYPVIPFFCLFAAEFVRSFLQRSASPNISQCHSF